MPDATAWIRALRIAHDRFATLLGRLDDDTIRQRSYDSEWSIAQVASHLGSQAEIYTMFLDAGLAGQDAPGVDRCRPIWDQWNSFTPERQVSGSILADEEFLSRLEGLSQQQEASFAVTLEGADLDLAGFAADRLSECALHTWDIAVALDPKATIPADTVELLVDTLPGHAGRADEASAERSSAVRSIRVRTAAPQRSFTLTTGSSIALEAVHADQTGRADRDDLIADSKEIQLPSEALIRLVFGRLDPAHTPAEVAGNDLLPVLRGVFPGF